MLAFILAAASWQKEHVDFTGDQTISGDAFVSISYKSTASWKHGGAALFKDGTTVSVVACVFQNCESNFGGAASFGSIQSVFLAELVCTGCHAEENGGAFDFTDVSQVVIDSCQFVSCWLDSEKGHYGGALFCDWNTLVKNITVKNTAFHNCSATDNGAAVYLGNVNGAVFDEVRFSDLKCNGQFAVFVSGQETQFIDSKVKNCDGFIGCQTSVVCLRTVFSGGSTGVKAQGSLKLHECDIRSVQNAAICAGDLTVTDCMFTDVVSQEPMITCTEPQFHKVHAQKVRAGPQNTVVENCKFWFCKNTGSSGVVYTSSPVKVSGCRFKENVNGGIVCVNSSSVEIRHSAFEDNYGTNAGAASAIVLSGVHETVIYGCEFNVKRETGTNQSVIKLSGDDAEAKISFERSYFTCSNIEDLEVKGLYINSTMKGSVTFTLPMCFDLTKGRSIYFSEGQNPAQDLNIFECVDCIPQQKNEHRLTNGQISGICAAASFGFIAIVLGTIWCVKRNRSKDYSQPLMEQSGNFETYT